jgi:hypothetical protein
VLALAAAVLIAAPTPAQLLRTYAPVVVLHPDERFAPEAVAGFLAAAVLERRTATGAWEAVAPQELPRDAAPWRLNLPACTPRVGVASLDCYAAAPRGPPTVYGRATRTPDRIVLQYWLWTPYDFWSGLFPPSDFLWQAHEGDWEAVAVVLDARARPLYAGYSRHCSGARRAWSRVAHAGGTHPLVYVALGSHSHWFGPGAQPIDTRCYPQVARAIFDVHLTEVLDWTGEGRRLVPRLVDVTTSRASWLRFPGTWGEEQWFHAPDPVNTVPYGTAPVGPAFHDLWRRPLRTLARWPRA